MSNNNRTQAIAVDEPQAVVGLGEEIAKSSTTQRKKALLLLAAVVVAVVAVYFAWNAFRYEDTDDAQVDGHVMPLSARITGQVEEVHVIGGELVHAGDVLVTIDPQD